jgi:hypothetical protein
MTRQSWNTFKNLFSTIYEFRHGVMDALTPVDINVLVWTLGDGITHTEMKRYLTPIRMMMGIEQWLETKMSNGYNVMLVGDQVSQMIDTISSVKKSVLLRMIRKPFSFLLVVASTIVSEERNDIDNRFHISIMSTIPQSMVGKLANDTTAGYVGAENPDYMSSTMKMISSRKTPDIVITGTDMVGTTFSNWGLNLSRHVERNLFAVGDTDAFEVTGPYPVMNEVTYVNKVDGDTEHYCVLRLTKEGTYTLENAYITTNTAEVEDADRDGIRMIIALPSRLTVRGWVCYWMMLDCSVADKI